MGLFFTAADTAAKYEAHSKHRLECILQLFTTMCVALIRVEEMTHMFLDPLQNRRHVEVRLQHLDRHRETLEHIRLEKCVLCAEFLTGFFFVRHRFTRIRLPKTIAERLPELRHPLRNHSVRFAFGDSCNQIAKCVVGERRPKNSFRLRPLRGPITERIQCARHIRRKKELTHLLLE